MRSELILRDGGWILYLLPLLLTILGRGTWAFYDLAYFGQSVAHHFNGGWVSEFENCVSYDYISRIHSTLINYIVVIWRK